MHQKDRQHRTKIDGNSINMLVTVISSLFTEVLTKDTFDSHKEENETLDIIVGETTAERQTRTQDITIW